MRIGPRLRKTFAVFAIEELSSIANTANLLII